MAGSLSSLPTSKQELRAPGSTVFSSLAAQTIAPPVVSAPLLCRVEGQCPMKSRPWSEVKSRRGAPKRRDTEGFACPNPQCPSFGNTDAHLHALVGDGKHGRAEPIGDLSRPCVPHHVQCSTAHASLPFENSFPAGRSCADGAGRRAGRFRGSASLRLSSGHHHEPFSPVLVSMRTPCMNASFAICGSRISN
jgi:hypothetical protein